MLSKHKKRLPKEGLNKILIRGTNWIGDAVLTLPAIASVRAAYPESRISILAKPVVADIYKLFAQVDEIIIYKKQFDNPLGVFRLARVLYKKRFDAAILLQNAIEAAIMTFAARIKLRAGYNSDGRGLLLTHSVKRTSEVKEIHQVGYYLEMAKALGCPPVGQEMNLQSKINRVTAQNILREFIPGAKKIIIGIAPGATYGPAKRWLPDRFAAVADKLKNIFDCQIILLGGRDDWKTAEEVKRWAGADLINIAGKTTVREAVYLISQCSLFISNDSGLMHIAGALNIPTVAIFGSTNPVTTSPVGEKIIIVRKEVSCSPCLKETCPTDFRCMNLITVDDVLSAAQKIMKRS
ncbi:MAG: lipopolysaccharide heptosyltransferase II [Syntrophaceae bacterium]|nr:lipopolysaccharide heptosyltransferase II [Syntrophaceae bacterium]